MQRCRSVGIQGVGGRGEELDAARLIALHEALQIRVHQPIATAIRIVEVHERKLERAPRL